MSTSHRDFPRRGSDKRTGAAGYDAVESDSPAAAIGNPELPKPPNRPPFRKPGSSRKTQVFGPSASSEPSPVVMCDIPLSPARRPMELTEALSLAERKGQKMEIMSESERTQGESFLDRHATMLTACLGNISTAYNLVIIDYVLKMMNEDYPSWGVSFTSLIAACSLAGAIVGQLTFGYIGDVMGREKGMILTLALSVLGAAFSSALTWGNHVVYYVLALSRFILGLGVGGVYPLSATSVAESTQGDSGKAFRVALVFSFQGWGQLLGPVAVAVCVSLFSTSEFTWRLVLMLGVLPGTFVLYRSLRSRRNSDGVRVGSGGSQPSFLSLLSRREYWGKLAGTAGTWFLFDICFYGNIIFAPTVLNAVFDFKDSDVGTTAAYSALLAAIALPGYYFSVCFAEKLGNRVIQLQGFAMMTVIFAAMGCWYEELQRQKGLLLLIYGLTFFFSNFGPNATTFALPAETYPPEVRGRFNGISAAAGKLGATLGAALFKPIFVSYGPAVVLILCGVVSFLGWLLTYLFVAEKAERRDSKPPPSNQPGVVVL